MNIKSSSNRAPRAPLQYVLVRFLHRRATVARTAIQTNGLIAVAGVDHRMSFTSLATLPQLLLDGPNALPICYRIGIGKLTVFRHIFPSPDPRRIVNAISVLTSLPGALHLWLKIAAFKSPACFERTCPCLVVFPSVAGPLTSQPMTGKHLPISAQMSAGNGRSTRIG